MTRAKTMQRPAVTVIAALVALVMLLVTGCRVWGGGPLMKPMSGTAAGQVASAVTGMGAPPVGTAAGPATGPGTDAGAAPVNAVTPVLDPNGVPVPGDRSQLGPAGFMKPTVKQMQPLKGTFVPEERISRGIQALSGDVVKKATVTLLGPGNIAVAAGLTDDAGNFDIITPAGWTAADGAMFIVEVTKPMGSGGGAGTSAFRFRTVVQYSGGNWLSCTNTTTATKPAINAYTTAVALVMALDTGLAQTLAIGKVDVSGATPKLNAAPAFPGHPDSEIKALADDIAAYLTNNVDPTGAVNAIKPTLTGINPGSGFPGALVTITGQGFSPVNGGNTVSFNGTNATAFYLATNTTLIVAVPQGASTGNVTVATTRGGVSANSMPFTVLSGLAVKVVTSGLDVPYYVAGAEIVSQRGNRTVTLYPGSSQIVFATGQAATFIVTAAGTVDAGMSNGALTGTGSQVSFNTVAVTISPNTYVGNYIISGGFLPSYVMGNVTATLIKGLQSYQLIAGTPHLFDVNSAGNVAPRGTWATGGAASLAFNNIPLKIEANGFQQGWSINNVTPSSQIGTYTVFLPMDSVSYVLNVMGTTVPFDINGSGDVNTRNNPYADGGAQVITMKMTNLKLWARGYTGMYSVTNVTGWVTGDQDMVVMKNFTYRMTFWPGNSFVAFAVDGSGNLTILNAGGQASTDVMGVVGNAQLEFKTKTITVADGGWKGNFGVLYGQKAGSWTWIASVSKKPNWVITTEQFVLIHGMTNYYFLYFYPGSIDHYLNFNLDKSDNLTVVGWGSKTSDKVIKPIVGQTITLNTSSVSFSSSGWQGYWGILYGVSPYQGWAWLASDTGEPNWFYNGQDRNHTLLLGLTDYYQIGFWPLWVEHYLSMSIDGNGVITTKAVNDSKVTTNAVLIDSPAKKITLNTGNVSIKTDGFKGLTGFLYGDGPKTAWTWLRNTSGDGAWNTVDRSWKFMKGIKNYYHLAFYPATTDYYYTFDFETGTLAPVGGGPKTTGDFYDSLAGNVIDYKTTPKIPIKLNGWTGYYGLLYGAGPTIGWTWLSDEVERCCWSGYNQSRNYQFLKGLVDYYYFYFWPGDQYWVNFNVDSAGGILARGAGAKADGSSLLTGTNKLEIAAVPVDMNANGWTGLWGFLYGCGPKCAWTWLTSDTGQQNWVQGTKTYSMVKGLKNYYYLYFYPGNGNYWLNLNIDSAGVLSASENPDTDKVVRTSVATYTPVAGRQTVKFNVGDLKINPNNYTAYWGVLYGCGARCGWTWFPSNDTGQENVQNWVYPVGKSSPTRNWKVLRGIDNYYHFTFYPGWWETSADLNVDPTSGNVSVASVADWVTTAAFGTSGNQLNLQTQRVVVNPNGWMGYHGFMYSTLYQNADRTGPLTSAYGWLYNDRWDACCWNTHNVTQQADSNNWPAWYLVKGLKSYYIHSLYPGGKNFYRTVTVNADGSYSFPNDGADVTTSLYTGQTGTTHPAGTLTLNTRPITVDRAGYTGYWGFMYGGNDGRTWLGNTRNNGQAWLRAYTGDATYDNPPYTLLLGVNNYYLLNFYPGSQYYASLHFNASTSKFEFTTEHNGQNITPSAALDVSTANVLRFGTRTMRITASGPPAGMTWTARHGDAGVYAEAMWDLQNNSYDYLTGTTYPTRDWKLVKGMKAYYTVYQNNATLPTGFGTNADGTPNMTSVNVGGVVFNLSAQ